MSESKKREDNRKREKAKRDEGVHGIHGMNFIPANWHTRVHTNTCTHTRTRTRTRTLTTASCPSQNASSRNITLCASMQAADGGGG